MNDLAKLRRAPCDVARWQKAQECLLGGRSGPALTTYHELASRFPGVGQLWMELGIAAMGQLEFDLADQAFQRAKAIDLGQPDALVLLGQQYHRLRRPAQARECFELAVKANPRSLHAQLSLAVWYERERRLPDACRCVDACLASNPSHPQAQCVQALLLHRQGRNPEAETLLREILARDSRDPNVTYSSRQLLGVVLDQLGRYPEAMQCLAEAKAILRKTADVASMERDYDRADYRRRQLLQALTPATIARWRQETPQPQTGPQPTLLGGHPRSGTTLLEQMLGAHPAVQAIDESEAFAQEIWDQLAPMRAIKGLTLESLSGIPQTRREEMRRRYLKSLLREINGTPLCRALLDKNPSPTAALHLWVRLFPHSRVIIALRDPRDVVLSCYFQNLMLTPTNANFLSLQRAVKHYADLMDVWLRMRELGGFEWIECRYEDLVQNPVSEGQRITRFLGLEWQPGQEQFHQSARQKVLFAPTYSDVTQPVHKRAIRRWENYARELSPFLDRLRPYCQALGYDA
jgi:tetratricopeptide (TPR) repeat protein